MTQSPAAPDPVPPDPVTPDPVTQQTVTQQTVPQQTVARSRPWHRPLVRRALLAALLAAATVVTVLIMLGELRTAAQAQPSLARPVTFGTWKDLHYGTLEKPVTAQARVAGLEKHDHLTKERGAITRREGATYVVARIECRCPVSKGLLAPKAVVVDDRGRQWEKAETYDRYDELSDLAEPSDVGSADAMRDGVTTYGVLFLVPDDATGLKVFLDPYGGNYLYGD
jgi:hypothetical protein